MEPLDPNDPLWKLLGKSRDVKVRPNFVQNVVREARNTPQERGWWAKCLHWGRSPGEAFPVGKIVGFAAVALMASAAFWLEKAPDSPQTPVVVEATKGVNVLQVEQLPLVSEVETQLESLDHADALLALEDTNGLSDREIAYLLY